MRFRIRQGGPAARFVFDRASAPLPPPPKPEAARSLAEELDNPYGRYYGKARSREDLLNRRDPSQALRGGSPEERASDKAQTRPCSEKGPR